MAESTTHANKTPAEHGVKDDRDLEVSYGQPIPQPRQKKGDFVAFGMLAGSDDTAPVIDGARTTTFGDSVKDNSKNI